MMSMYGMKYDPRVVSDVKSTRLFLGVKYVSIKKSGVPRFMLGRLLFICCSMEFGVFCCIVRLIVLSSILTF